MCQNLRSFLVGATLLLGACGLDGGPDADRGPLELPPGLSKADSTFSCKGYCGKKAPGCYCDSVCATYGDCCPDKVQTCDAAPVSVTFECMGVKSRTFFDLTVVDVGDQEGLVEVNDGGAPRTFTAQYDELAPVNGYQAHRFVFGFDEYNSKKIASPYAIEISGVSFAFLRGSVKYTGKAEELVCYRMSPPQPNEIVPCFECLSLKGNTLFDLDIVDVGDEEGSVTVNDGGAPVTYRAEYNELAQTTGYPRHRFVFGFDELNAGDIAQLHSVVVEEKSINFAAGNASYTTSSSVVCHINK